MKELILFWTSEFQPSIDIQTNMFRCKADVYDRRQENVCLGDLDLEIIMLSVSVETMTVGGIFKG